MSTGVIMFMLDMISVDSGNYNVLLKINIFLNYELKYKKKNKCKYFNIIFF